MSRPLEGGGQPGFVCGISKKELLVGTGSGLLSILELQPQGKSAMPVSAFLQGRKLEEGMIFTSHEI